MTEAIRSEPEQYGALAAALAKAQAAFPAIQRDKEVVVQKKAGGQYTFKYAPLDTILAATRKPLSDNGLALVQLLDDGELVTMLLHSSGARLSGRVALPTEVDIQGLGSAITYLRRYSLQAILGIAAEEDDDGNRASGNTTTAPPPKGETESLVGALDRKRAGTIVKTKSRGSDLLSREQPDGTTHIGFKLETAKGAIEEVWATGDAAAFLFAVSGMDPDKLDGEHATVDGLLYRVTEANRKAKHRLKLTFIEVRGAFWPSTETSPFPVAATSTQDEPERPAEAVSEPSSADVEELDTLAETLPWPDAVS